MNTHTQSQFMRLHEPTNNAHKEGEKCVHPKPTDGFKKQNSKPQPKRNSKSGTFWNFPGSPVIKSSCFHCREHEFNPQLRNQDPHVVLACEKKKKKGTHLRIPLID